MRILAMDVGEKYIGMAISDMLGWTAQGIKTLHRQNDDLDFAEIQSVIDEYAPCQILLGFPKNMNGTVGPQGQKVKEFGDQLKNKFGIDIMYWDERLTTVYANRTMIDADISRKKRKKMVDRMAAVFILQNYLDYLNNKKGE